jgi:glycosyltransferase involved in cell wall biosynthesis
MESQKIAVCFLGDYRFDARSINMIKALIKNHSVYIFHFKKTSVLGGEIHSKKLIEINIVPTQKKILKYIHWTALVYQILKKNTFQKIIASDLYSLLPIYLSNIKAKIIYDSREIFTELSIHNNRKIKKYIIRFIENLCLKEVSVILTSANSDTRFLKNIYSHYKHIKYYTIFNFPHVFPMKNKSSYLRSKYSISKKDIILIYQGVLQKGRGIKQMIHIVQNTSNLVGVIVGDGEEKLYYKKYVQGLSLSKKIFFLGSVPYLELLQITCSADIGLALIRPSGISYQYALPNKLFEYAISGIPCLSSNLQNMKKYIKKYSLGLCVNNNLKSQINAINQLSCPDAQKKYFLSRNNSELTWKYQEKKFIDIICN